MQISGVIISGPHLDVTYTPLKNLSLTTATDQTIPDQAENLLYQLVTEVASDAFSGVRWLFPVAVSHSSRVLPVLVLSWLR